MAAYGGHAAVAVALLEARADPGADTDSWTPLHTACNTEQGEPESLKKGRADVIAALIAARTDLAAKDKDDCTPLWYAACNGFREGVQALVAAGADIDAEEPEDQDMIRDLMGSPPQ